MRTTRSALGAAAVAALLLTSSSPARAATLSAVDGDSHASITTPIKAPADSACSRIPFAYALGADVDYAAVVILDANSAMVARSPELAAGTGTGRLGICGATLHGKASPFTLQLLVTHTEDSGKGAVTAASPRSVALLVAPAGQPAVLGHGADPRLGRLTRLLRRHDQDLVPRPDAGVDVG